MARMYRQGDVLLVKVAEVPAHAVRVAQRPDHRVILAEGEATGHHHAVTCDRATLLVEEAEAIAAKRWLQIDGNEPVALTHQEHATILLEPGVYEVRRQREYHPSEIRRVAD